MEIKIKYFSDEIERLEYIGGSKSDWIDLRVAKDVELKAGSTFKNFGIIQPNSMGIIDETYCGDTDQWFFPALAMRDTKICVNDRICQFRIIEHQPKLSFCEVKELTRESRGGFGTTGKN